MYKYLGFDLGTKTLGIASSQGVIASPLKTIRFSENNFNQLFDLLQKDLVVWKPTKIIIGIPINMDGSKGERAQMITDFINHFLGLFCQTHNIELIQIDERLTTRMANAILLEANIRRQKRKIIKDSLAAQFILETYLQKEK